MDIFRPLFLLLLSTFLVGCGVEPTTPNDTLSHSDTSGVSTMGSGRPKDPQCAPGGKVLEGNKIWMPSRGLSAFLLADSTTADPAFGPSHRVVKLFKEPDCELLLHEVLPINFSPDYPYYFASVNYNNTVDLVAIRGFDKIHFLDLRDKKLLAPIQPFPEAAEPTSGLIKKAELWEQYLVGYAESGGAFVIRLQQPNAPQQIKPIAAFTSDKLFLLPSDGEKYQAILPEYDYDNGQLMIHPVFKEPLTLDAKAFATSEDGQFLAIAAPERMVAIDLKLKQEVAIPDADRLLSPEEAINGLME